MNFSLTDEQRMLIKAVRDFVAKELAPLEEEVEQTGVLAPDKARAIFEKSRALGFYALNIPEEFGGMGYSVAEIDALAADEVLYAEAAVSTLNEA